MDMRRLSTSRAFNPESLLPESLLIPDFEWLGWLTKESDLITENSILESNLNSNEVRTPGGGSSLSTTEVEPQDRDGLFAVSIQIGAFGLTLISVYHLEGGE